MHTHMHVCEFHCGAICVGLVYDYASCVYEQIVVSVVSVNQCAHVCVFMSLYVDGGVRMSWS